jgi:hypothetical protein
MSQNTNSITGEKIHVSNAGWYTFVYPNQWVVTDDGVCITVREPVDGVGALQVSSYQTPEPEDPTDLLFEYLSDNRITSEEETRYYEANGNRIAATSFVRKDGYLFRVWFIARDLLLLMVTYNCKSQFREVELESIDRIVDSIALIDL